MSPMHGSPEPSPAPSSPPRRLLLASYWYPPAIGAAAERIGAFARYLPAHGWEVHVLTARRSTEPQQPPNVTVHAVDDPQGGAIETFPDYDPRRSNRPGIKRYFRDFIFPDRFRRWMDSAHRYAAGELHRLKFDAILASFPPASAAALGLRLHETFSAPFFLDMRDCWLGPGGYEPRYAFARKRHLRLYADCVRAATGIIAVSDTMADDIAAEHGLPREKVAVIANGYDPSLPFMPPPPSPPRPDEKLVIAHVGTVIPRNRPDLFLDALLRLPREVAAGLCIRFVGNLSRDYLHAAGLSPLVEATGLIPRDAAWREIADAHALLLLTGRDAGHWTPRAKLFEYLAAGRPVLCLEEAPGSYDYRLLSTHASDRTFRAAIDDAGEIAAAIGRLRDFCRSASAAILPPPADLATHSREVLAGRLAKFLVSRLGAT